jgi:hypothetical protein
MSIKETIKFKGTDTFIKIPFSIANNLVDYQQEIDNANEEAKKESINEVIDHEVRRYTYNEPSSTILKFFFGTGHNVEFGVNGAGFSEADITNGGDTLLNSFYILDFYDSFNDQTQTKIFTTYMTQILTGELDVGVPIPEYTISNSSAYQFNSWYVPQDYLDPFLYSGYTVITGYVKLSFFNAKTGRVTLFYNKANDGLNTPQKMYFTAYLYPATMGWQFITDTPEAYEVAAGNAYAQRINDRVDGFDNLQQEYPEGLIFEDDGTYSTE